MTLAQVLEDIKSDRRKKVILDCDTANEMDDQYAVAYTLGMEDRIDLLALTAVHYQASGETPLLTGMEESYREFLRVMEKTGKSGVCPVYRGAAARISEQPDLSPIESDASENIVRLVHEAGELVYIIATGPLTNVTSALLMDPTIKDKICIIWLGGNCFECDSVMECNIWGDYAAARIAMNSGVHFIQLPAYGDKEKGHGTQMLSVTHEELRRGLIGESEACVFFRETLPMEHHGKEEWTHVIWDIAGPAVLCVPDAFELKVIPAPVFTDAQKYAFDSTRHKVCYMERLDPAPIYRQMYEAINKL